MLYVKVENDIAAEYPLSYEQVCERVVDPYGKTRLPVDQDYLALQGYFPVIPYDCPSVAPTSVVTIGLPIFANGVWHENYIIREMTEDEKNNNRETKGFEIRRSRDAMLRNTVDNINPMRWDEFNDSEKLAWKEYRQTLLDIPQQEGFPWVVTWPTQPQ
jgi:hypothetical protein